MSPRAKALLLTGITAACAVVAFVAAYVEEDGRHAVGLAAVGVFLAYGTRRLVWAIYGRGRRP
ncbi:hypothetical protein FJV41_19835 [Myxococcus llanfairpwllgwyngyllgogerychwyrndrobwllllantysiliogogogochensis]|uniref:Lipoprotein n=1 Tax=Myxococcus llanfairpwllgwyngyllgogerychwyrndrobwllllantysiliogogogochensis TaxID=2590453 RepID=A0A540WYY6_9BACT|nr:hypothetical protein [Myxococcus llanfairpwllgwyngyllgogerychwyrndrobwllllantysiliogogogochensis]TQF14222.1 hypothetical protein FJV41_19835 [Myxococcus llanfairpwllgwyngyllgogerychwyrndrobwllllantysiliogogogochensis]